MRVLFINMPIGIETGRPPNNVPTGLAILSALLRERAHEVRILDLNALRPDWSFIPALLEGEYDLVGLSGLITTLSHQERVARLVRALHPKAFLVSGGGLATDVGEDLLDWIPELDAIVRGEAEGALEPLEHLALGHAPAVPSCRVSEHSGRWALSADPPHALDALPWPAWDLLPLDIYLANPIWGGNSRNSSVLPYASTRSMNVLTSRGCPWTCRFCVTGYGFGRYRFRSAENVLREVELLLDRYATDFIGFVDDNFMVNRARLRELCGGLKRLGIVWGCHGRLDQASPETLETMASSGCVYIGYGGESASQPILDAMEKRITVGAMRDAVRNTKRAGIVPNLTWISGYPGERREDLRATVRFILEEELGNRRMFVATPYPGTPLFSDSEPRIREHYPSLKHYVSSLGDADRFLVNLSAMSDSEFRQCRQYIEAGELERI